PLPASSASAEFRYDSKAVCNFPFAPCSEVCQSRLMPLPSQRLEHHHLGGFGFGGEAPLLDGGLGETMVAHRARVNLERLRDALTWTTPSAGHLCDAGS